MDRFFDSVWTGVGCSSVLDTLRHYQSYGTAAGPAYGAPKSAVLQYPWFVERWVTDVRAKSYSVRTLAAACAKDELLDRVKIETRDKQRAVISTSIYMVLWQYYLFNEQNELVKGLWEEGASFGYGFRKQYCGWHAAMEKFFGHKVYSLDFKRCDKTVLNIVLDWFYHYRVQRLEEAYGQSFKSVASCLVWDLTRSLVVLPDGSLMVKYRGNPSGQMNTTFDTIVFMQVLKVAAWMEEGVPLWEHPSFHYGDDTLLSYGVEHFVSFASSLGCTVEVEYVGDIVGAPFISHVIRQSSTGKLVGCGNINKAVDRLRFTGGFSAPIIAEIVLGLYEECFPWYGTREWDQFMLAVKFVCDRAELLVEVPSYGSLMRLYFGRPPGHWESNALLSKGKGFKAYYVKEGIISSRARSLRSEEEASGSFGPGEENLSGGSEGSSGPVTC
jgi:hypothetical protein